MAPIDKPPSGAAIPLRIYRVPAGQSVRILLRSWSHDGIWTHWIGSRSEWCEESTCPPHWHKTRRRWVKYESCDRWDDPQGQWLPCIAEFAHPVELDMRGLAKRAQIWLVSHPLAQARGKGYRHFPVSARLLEERSHADVPHADDILPALIHAYGRADLRLDIPSPFPPRVLCTPVVQAPPADLAPPASVIEDSPTLSFKERRERFEKERRDKKG